ncbi:hypothetical protein Bbelb_281300 [Branchiostoma belcheri]|nr:hypothetical protein Bbelb_281300 [Branchiostoma belcheri]
MEPCTEEPLPPSSSVDSEAEIAGHDKLTSPCALYRDTADEREGRCGLRKEIAKTSPHALYQNPTDKNVGWGSRNTWAAVNKAVAPPLALYQDPGKEATLATSHLYRDNGGREGSSERIGRSNGQDNGQGKPLLPLYSDNTGVDSKIYEPAPPCDQNVPYSRDGVVQTGATTPKQAIGDCGDVLGPINLTCVNDNGNPDGHVNDHEPSGRQPEDVGTRADFNDDDPDNHVYNNDDLDSLTYNNDDSDNHTYNNDNLDNHTYNNDNLDNHTYNNDNPDDHGELHRLWRDHVGIRPRYAGRGGISKQEGQGNIAQVRGGLTAENERRSKDDSVEEVILGFAKRCGATFCRYRLICGVAIAVAVAILFGAGLPALIFTTLSSESDVGIHLMKEVPDVSSTTFVWKIASCTDTLEPGPLLKTSPSPQLTGPEVPTVLSDVTTVLPEVTTVLPKVTTVLPVVIPTPSETFPRPTKEMALNKIQTTKRPKSTTNRKETVFVCEGENKKLSCPAGETLVIDDAYYGSTNDTQDCRAEKSLLIVWKTCQGLQHCVMAAINVFFGDCDPCNDAAEFLKVSYRCYSEANSAMKERVGCSDPLGMASGHIPDNKITASSRHMDDHYASYHGRFIQQSYRWGAWTARIKNIGEWLEQLVRMPFNPPHPITNRRTGKGADTDVQTP